MWFWFLACEPREESKSACEDCEQGPLRVELALRPGIHDLVAVASGSGSAGVRWSWTLDGQQTTYATDRIPAHAVWPGQQWSVTASLPEGSATASVTIPPPPGGNVLVVVLDDVGVDKLSIYGLNEQAPPTPNLDALASEGVVFRRAYASPTCSPTRAEMLTGRYGRRSGAGWLVDMGRDSWELPLDAITIPEALRQGRGLPFSDAFLGKWHLAGYSAPSGNEHPRLQGFSSFAGTMGYLVPGTGEVDGYFSWWKTTDGADTLHQVYNTTDIVNDAIIKLSTLPEPFLLWVSFNAAHVPLHEPPPELHDRPLGPNPSDPELYAAMLQAWDTEFGRLLEAMSPELRERTTIVVVGDNGTTEFVMDEGFDRERGKHTLYEGGIRVPLVVTGPHVASPGTSDALVHVVDIFTTTMEIAGVPLTDIGERLALDLEQNALFTPRVLDGRSLLPFLEDPSRPSERQAIYAQILRPNGPPPWAHEEYVLMDGTYKLLRRPWGDELFLMPPPGGYDEGPNLLQSPLTPEQEEAYLRLHTMLESQLHQTPYEGF